MIINRDVPPKIPELPDPKMPRVPRAQNGRRRGTGGVVQPKGRHISTFGNSKSTAMTRASALGTYVKWLDSDAAPAGKRPLPLVRCLPEAFVMRARLALDSH